MRKLILLIITLTISSTLFSQEEVTNKNSYLEKINTLRKINFYNLNDIQEITSDCGAYFNTESSMLSTEDECRGKFWMENLRDLNTPYEIEINFTPLSNYNSEKNTYLGQIFLGNSPNGFTWIGYNKSGELTISVRDKEGWTDKLKVIKTDKINFNEENHLKFIHFPDGIYYIELNSYSRWSYDLPPASQKIPLIGLSNRINFYSDIKLSKLDLNMYHEKDDFIAEMEDLSANMQADKLLSIDSDKERIEFRNSMRIMFDSPCYGNCKNGYGVYDFNDGVQYMGEWKDSEFEGNGILYNNGAMYYKGSFENGKMQGYGVVYKDSDILFEGQWDNGNPIQKDDYNNSTNNQSEEEAFNQVVSLIENADKFNYEESIEIISQDFDDLTITVKTTLLILFSGGNKTESIVQLNLNDLKRVNEKEELSSNSSVVMTFKKQFKTETIDNDGESSFSYNDYITVSFEEYSEDVDRFIKALNTLM